MACSTPIVRSSELSEIFRAVLLDVSRYLTKRDVRKLAFQCPQICDADRESIEDGIQLFDEFQRYGVLTELDVDRVIAWIDKLQLKQPLALLKGYKDEHLTSPDITQLLLDFAEVNNGTPNYRTNKKRPFFTSTNKMVTDAEPPSKDKDETVKQDETFNDRLSWKYKDSVETTLVDQNERSSDLVSSDHDQILPLVVADSRQLEEKTKTQQEMESRSEKQEDPNNSLRSAKTCPKHKHCTLDRYCNSCNQAVCAECVCLFHMTHCEVVSLDNITESIEPQEDKLHILLNVMGHSCKIAKDLCLQKIVLRNNCRESVVQEIEQNALDLHERVDKMKKEMMLNLSCKENDDKEEVRSDQESIRKFAETVENLKEKLSNSNGTELDKWHRINEVDSTLKALTFQITKKVEDLKQPDINILYKKIANDGIHGELTFSTFIGGVMILDDQLVQIFDDRRAKSCVRLICIDPKDLKKEYWDHSVAVNDLHSPVVLSSIYIRYDRMNHVLFAVGKEVYIVRPRWVGYLCDSVESVSCLKIGAVTEGSWITSIVANYPVMDYSYEFFVTISYSLLLLEFDASGKALRSVDPRKFNVVTNVRNVAYVNEIVAIICRDREKVFLLTDDNDSCSCFTPPPSSRGLFPKFSVCTGYNWLVLFAGKKGTGVWKISKYEKTGELMKVCVEGTASNHMDFPLNIAFWKQKGVICFANNTVRVFKY